MDSYTILLTAGGMIEKSARIPRRAYRKLGATGCGDAGCLVI